MDEKRINRYQIVKTLGEGSFGKVKLAYHLATNSRVALKIINRRTLQKTDMQGRVEREISYLRLLRHRHIIKLYEVIKKKDEIIMVLEFAGKELFDHIVQQGRMSEPEARKFFQQIISAVQYCHKHKIVHRDLKPENLLLDEKMEIKIADFGLSNIMTDGNFLKTSCGSPNYAAPEVISGKLYAGPEVDVWSCGVILYVMLVGRLPFDEESIPELFQRISQGIYSIPDFVSSGARNLLKRMLVVNPLERITVDEIIKDKWFQTDLSPELFPQTPRIDHKADQNITRYLSVQLGYSNSDIVDAIEGTGRNLDPASEAVIKDAYKLVLDSQDQSPSSSLDEYMASTGVNAGSNAGGNLSSSPNSHQNSAIPLNRARSSSSASQRGGKPSSYNRHGVPAAYSFDQTHLGPVVGTGSSIAVLPTSLPQYHLAYMQSRNVPMSKKLSPVTIKKSKMRWHFGIRSRSYPLDVMGEIYRALAALGAEWTIPTEEDIWTIYVRWHNEEKPSHERSGFSETLKMRIQLYQLEQNNYLVDFKFDGFENKSKKTSNSSHNDGNIISNDAPAPDDTFSAYPFLRLATDLILELAVNSQS